MCTARILLFFSIFASSFSLANIYDPVDSKGFSYRISINGPMSSASSDLTWKSNASLFPDNPGIYQGLGSPEITAESYLSFKDQLDYLEYAEALAFGSFRVDYGNWEFASTLTWVKINIEDYLPRDDFYGLIGIGWQVDGIELEVDYESIFLEASFGYVFSPYFALYAGGRWIRHHMDVAIQTDGTFESPEGSEPVSAGMTPIKSLNDWVDPMLGVRLTQPLNEDFYLQGKMDVSGLVDVDYAIQVMAGLVYQVSDSMELVGGYRFFQYQYDDQDLRYKQTYQGPLVQMAFLF